MVKKDETVVVDAPVTAPEAPAPVADAPMDERTALWQEYIAAYKASNPVKAVAKEKNGEFAAPPFSFQGKKRVRQLANGEVRTEIY